MNLGLHCVTVCTASCGGVCVCVHTCIHVWMCIISDMYACRFMFMLAMLCVASSPGHSHIFNVTCRKGGGPGTWSHVWNVTHASLMNVGDNYRKRHSCACAWGARPLNAHSPVTQCTTFYPGNFSPKIHGKDECQRFSFDVGSKNMMPKTLHGWILKCTCTDCKQWRFTDRGKL